MKMHEAISIVCSPIKKPRTGFFVHFERVEGAMLASDYFPEPNEEPILTEELAWMLASEFAARTTGKCVNVYVVRALDFTPVPGYETRKIKNRKEIA